MHATTWVSDVMHVLICGGAAIGVSIAYFLSRCGVRVTVFVHEIDTIWGPQCFRRRTGEALHPARDPLVILENISRTIGEYNGTVNLSGRVSRMQATGSGDWVHCKPMPQISAQIRNFWVLEALCSAAVT
jgi:glycine/D-amino acid oxidase-like deaminating enzyme